jgi:myo-inositol-1(or 4)-monophosphatase
MTPDLPTLLGIARTAVQHGADHLTTHAVQQIASKGPGDVVTDLDLSVEQVVLAFLSTHTPGIGRRSEEAGGDPATPLRWVLDPVDGSVNLAHGLPLYGISLALVDDVRALLGVISLPMLGRTFWGAEGLGAWCNDQRISPSTVSDLRSAVVAVGDYGTGDGAEERNAVAVALHRELAATAGKVRMFGSAAVDLALTAAGALDASITLGNRDWDMAAGVAIARAAGATVTDTDGSPHTLASRTTIVTAPGLTDPLISTLNKVTAGTSYAAARQRR